MRASPIAALVSGALFSACAARVREPAPPPAPTPLAVHVRGNALVDGAGAPLRLRGVSHAGTEYACVKGQGIFDSPADNAMIDAIAAWHVNVVRVPLHEHCWLGINGVDPRYSGDAYRRAIADFVARLHAKGLYAILDLHWSSAGNAKALDQEPMADRAHAVDFWSSVATTFKGDPAVIFDLFNEPFLGAGNVHEDPWACWKNGCTVHTNASAPFASAGMQELVDAIRRAGATQPLMLGGLTYANDVTGWLAHEPVDPEGALVASFHVYDFNECITPACWDAQLKPIAARVPVITGEIGEADCAHGFIDAYMAWADAAGVSYLAWTWNPWGGATREACGSNKIVLTSDFGGTPTPYGAGFKEHLAEIFANGAISRSDAGSIAR